MAQYQVHKGTAYFHRAADARDLAEALRTTYPEARTVEYTRGTAVQFHKSGPYWGPEAPGHEGCAWCRA